MNQETPSQAGLLDIESELSPLKRTSPIWSGQPISPRHQSLKLGIERENERLRGKPYIVVIFRHEYDIDGLTEYLDLVEGFQDKDTAIQFADTQLAHARTKTLEQPCYGDGRWQVVASGPTYPYKRKGQENPIVSRVSRDGFKAKPKFEYDSKYVEYEVLHTTGEGISAELIYFTGMQSEWENYLVKRGRGERHEP